MLTSSSSRPTRSSTTRPASAPGSPHGYRQQTMEPLWSPVGATGGNQRQIARANEPEKQAKTLAVGCDRLPRGVHAKEGVDGSSPSEGSPKRPGNMGLLILTLLRFFQHALEWNMFWNSQT